MHSAKQCVRPYTYFYCHAQDIQYIPPHIDPHCDVGRACAKGATGNVKM